MISIIVPVYNAELYIDECINSILAQSYQDFELILVNDGSKDKSLELCKKYEGERIKVLDKPNGGASSARNLGIKNAKGDFVVFIDSDDTIPVNAMQSLIENSSEEVDTVIGNFNHQYGDKIIRHLHMLKPGVYDYKDLLPSFIDDGRLSGFLISTSCSTLYRSSIIKNANIHFNEKLRINEDGLFNLEYALHARKVRMIEDVVYVTRKHNDSSRHTQFTKDNFNQILCDYIRNTYPKQCATYDFETQFKRRNFTVALWSILINGKVLGWKEGIRYIKSLLTDPPIPEAYQYIKESQLASYKKIMYKCMKWKQVCLVYILAHFIIPWLSSKIAR